MILITDMPTLLNNLYDIIMDYYWGMEHYARYKHVLREFEYKIFIRNIFIIFRGSTRIFLNQFLE